MTRRRYEVAEPRNHHIANVTPLHQPRSRAHPSMMYDREDENTAADCVLLTKIEAQLIASLLNCARGHLPSPRAVDQAIELLVGRKP